MGAIAVFRPAGQEAQTAAGVRSSRFLPKTARRAPQALEAGAFWVHRPKGLAVTPDLPLCNDGYDFMCKPKII
jgi:hypothetical protein